MKNLRAIEYITMNAYWFGLAYLWNGMHVIILPSLLLRFVPENLKNTYLGFLTFIGLVLAMLVQPISGAISDRSASRWGRRRPLILLGTVLDFVFIAGLALSTNYWMVFVSYFFLQLASNTAHGPAQGFIPDLVPEDKRGLLSGIKNLADIGGLIVGSLAAAYFMGSSPPNTIGALFSICAVLFVCAAITLTVHEQPQTMDQRTPLGESIAESIRRTFQIDYRLYPDYVWLIASRFLILLGIYAIQGFAQYYIRDVLRAPNPEGFTGSLVAIIGIFVFLLSLPAGYLADRVGRKPLIYLAGLVAAVAAFVLQFPRSFTGLAICGGFIGMALGIFLSANWALATDLIPKTEAGKYLGLSNLATAGAGATSRLIGPLIDTFNMLSPNLGYTLLFVIAAGVILAGTTLLHKVQVKSGFSCKIGDVGTL
ncbi:MAG: MFS transporter [Chloroflexi bacterium]|nr:MFS transporter [Chloroflexota bacterium]